ncbi:copper resistance protein CopC [Streptomyces phaeochromogenes]|uniref:copper resistance CopC family protein n=1 Tax=Streptomyces phaeochromogenes TaxID=1923 RepID=UPI002258D439|nr:copper resistance CopC family protein [Streptomyces phaeochromogenes]MCX5601258.1 copper resistance protein CopC [Streptomyces phaeochromogenes]
MYVTDRRAVRTAARALVVPAALAALAVAAPQAAAHTELDISSPGANAELAGLPPRVTLTFSDAMTQKYAKVVVTAPDGKSAVTGEPQVSGKRVTLALDPTARAGRYTVGYRVVSADGHPVAGSYTFTVAEANRPSPSPRATESAGAEAPRAAQESAPDKTDEESSGATVPVLAGVGALAAAAAGAYAVRRRRAGHGH